MKAIDLKSSVASHSSRLLPLQETLQAKRNRSERNGFSEGEHRNVAQATNSLQKSQKTRRQQSRAADQNPPFPSENQRTAGPQNSEFIFFYPRNPAKHLLHVRKTWARALKDAKVAKRRLYDCRSAFCSRMYAAGIQPVLIELLMGHAGNSLVHTYAKADDDFKRDAAARLEAFIASKNAIHDTSTTSAWVN
jgi:integrase